MMSCMRTTVRLDDELIEQLKTRARKENISLTRALNRALRDGLRAQRAAKPRRRPYREKPLPMGPAKVDLTKALALAAAWEDEEIVRKLTLGK